MSLRENFFVHCGDLVATTRPPKQFVTRGLFPGQPNSHDDLARRADERQRHQDGKENEKHALYRHSSAIQE
jgi:hypothetical protein